MDERRIVPVSVFEQTVLSQRQETEIINLSRNYLRQLRIPIENVAIFRQAAGVIGDAVRRGLLMEGKAAPDNKDRIGPTAKKGLKLREDLKLKTEELLRVTSTDTSLSLASTEFIGPYALPLDWYQQAVDEMRNFSLQADLTASEKLTELQVIRNPAITRIAGIGLTHLPDGLQSVSLNMFPGVDEQAKIIRNMIVAKGFKGTLSPLLTTDEVEIFADVSTSADVDSFSGTKFIDQLVMDLSIDSVEERAYLEGLCRQTSTILRNHPASKKDVTPIKEMDFSYRYFSRQFLLLHPVLEEPKIITVPDKLDPGLPHIWIDGVRIKDVTVPKPEALLKAIHQAEARGNQGAVFRLQQGIQSWRIFREAQSAHQQKIATCEQSISDNERHLEHALAADGPLPAKAYEVIYEVQAKALSKFKTEKREAERYAKIIEENLQLQQQAQEYEKWLRENYQDNLPDLLPLSKDLYLRQQQEKKAFLQRQLMSVKARLSSIEDLLEIDFFWRYGRTVDLGFTKDESKVNSLIKQFRQEIKRVKTEQLPAIVDIQDFNHHKDIVSFRSDLQKANMPKAFARFSRFWVNRLKRPSSEVEIKENTVEFKPQLVLKAVRYRVDILKQAMKLLQQREVLTAELTGCRQNLEVASNNPDTLLPADAIWAKKEALAFLQEIKASKIPVSDDLAQKEIVHMARSMDSLLRNFNQSILPEIIPDKDRLKEKLENNLSRLQYIKRVPLGSGLTPKENRAIRQTKKQRSLLERVSGCLDHPLFPLPEGEGLARWQFIRAWKRRVEFTNAMLSVEQAQLTSAEANTSYDNVTRAMWILRLIELLQHQKEELVVLKARDTEEEFINRMDGLSLALKDLKNQ